MFPPPSPTPPPVRPVAPWKGDASWSAGTEADELRGGAGDTPAPVWMDVIKYSLLSPEFLHHAS